MSRRTAAWGGGLALLAVLALGWGGNLVGAWGGRGLGEGRWVEVERRDLVATVGISGELQAVDTSRLGPPQLVEQWNFSVASLAPEGSQVEAGDPVIVFDTSELQQELIAEQTNRNSAAKELEKRRQEFELRREEEALSLAEAHAKLERLALQIDVPPELAVARELEVLRLQYELAEEEVSYRQERVHDTRRQAQADLAAQEAIWREASSRVEEIQGQIEAMTVRAPRAGTVIYLANWRGEKPKVSDSIWRNQRIIEIPDLRRLQARGMVDEDQAGRLEIGQAVTLFLDAHPDELVRATVEQIDRNVRRRAWHTPLKAVRLTLALEHTDPDRMRPGMRFRGQVEVARSEQVVTIPLAAVGVAPIDLISADPISADPISADPIGADPATTDPVGIDPARTTGATPRARVRTGLGWRWQSLGLGQRDARWVEVVQGLESGDQVWLPSAAAGGDDSGAGLQLPGGAA